MDLTWLDRKETVMAKTEDKTLEWNLLQNLREWLYRQGLPGAMTMKDEELLARVRSAFVS